MINEYTDYIAHGHKYFAVIDLGKKNSKGTKLRRYFYSANEYKAYLQGKKTTDDKLLGAASKVANKLSGVKAIGKGMATASKGIKDVNVAVKALKKKGFDEEGARAIVKARSAYGHTKRAGLTAGELEGNKLHSTDEKGNKYTTDIATRKITRDVTNDDNDKSKELISKQHKIDSKAKEAERVEKNKAALKANPEKSILKNPIRENFMERLIEKGINKANAEAMRKKLEETYKRATKIGESANNLKGRLDKLQEAFTSGDGDKALDAIDETLKDQEAIQKDILTIVDEMLPEAKNVADTFLDMGKKTLDTATAGPKAIVGDKDVKTFEDSSTTWDDVKISDNPDNMKKIQDAVDKAFKEKNKNRKK